MNGYFTGDCCSVTAEAKHVSTMGASDSPTKFGETEELDFSSVSSLLCLTSWRPINHRLSPTINKSCRRMQGVLRVFSYFALLCYLKK